MPINDQTMELFSAGRLCSAWETFGSHKVGDGYSFAVWAPNARSVAVAGDFSAWGPIPLQRDRRGVWSGHVPGAREGDSYKYRIEGTDGVLRWKADPFAVYAQCRPETASRLHTLSHRWRDDEWMCSRRTLQGPRNIYELHAGSWRRNEQGEFLSWEELAEELVPYLADMGYTHLELLPVMEHPFDGSWGYQSTGYFAATARFGTPEGLMELIDRCHQKGIGVILDWVPGHFCRDAHGLGEFDGTALYETGIHPDWDTYMFNYGRGEVRSFLMSSALFWLRVFHADGLRFDGVSSMLYLNFGVTDPKRKRFNRYGGEENLDAIDFLRQLNETIGRECPGTETYAEESSAWPLVTYPGDHGGLGFHYKWNMGWMNDTLRYVSEDFDGRRYHQDWLTFSMMYAFSENYVLPLSHDEVVHGKRSLIGRMPGDWWRQFAGSRLLQMYAMCHPGAVLRFMGTEFAQFIEWREYEALEWKLLVYPTHAGHQQFVKELNRLYKKENALWELDHGWEGFQWIDADNAKQGILSFVRRDGQGNCLLCILNFRPESREKWRIGVPEAGSWKELLSSDEERFGGSGVRNPRAVRTKPVPMHGQAQSIVIRVPPLGGTILKLTGEAMHDTRKRRV